jgi:hypothetical protein
VSRKKIKARTATAPAECPVGVHNVVTPGFEEMNQRGSPQKKKMHQEKLHDIAQLARIPRHKQLFSSSRNINRNTS